MSQEMYGYEREFCVIMTTEAEGQRVTINCGHRIWLFGYGYPDLATFRRPLWDRRTGRVVEGDKLAWDYLLRV